MLLFEQLALQQKNCRLQIFATDIDDDAVDRARLRTYPETIAADVTPERLSRFFTRTDGHSYQVNARLREAVTFAHRNLITDPPFSKLDLISCRNVITRLCIKRFTPAATRLFNLIATDSGRPLSDIVPRFLDPLLLSDAEQVLQNLAPQEREVPTDDGRWCLRRVVP